MIYDEELIVQDFINTIKENLNAEITKLNAEKLVLNPSDKYQLKPIPNTSYNYETLSADLLNYKDFFVMYGVADTPVKEAVQDNVMEDVGIVINIGTFDPGDKLRDETFTKLLRYRRALRSVIINNPEMFRGFAKPIMKSLSPDAFPYDQKNVILTIGLEIKASISVK